MLKVLGAFLILVYSLTVGNPVYTIGALLMFIAIVDQEVY